MIMLVKDNFDNNFFRKSAWKQPQLLQFSLSVIAKTSVPYKMSNMRFLLQIFFIILIYTSVGSALRRHGDKDQRHGKSKFPYTIESVKCLSMIKT